MSNPSEQPSRNPFIRSSANPFVGLKHLSNMEDLGTALTRAVRSGGHFSQGTANHVANGVQSLIEARHAHDTGDAVASSLHLKNAADSLTNAAKMIVGNNKGLDVDAQVLGAAYLGHAHEYYDSYVDSVNKGA